MECRLQARGVGHRFHHHPGLTDFDLCVAAGETVGLFGSNGAGKSTALSILAGCLPPTSGEVLLDGHPVYGPGLEVRRLIGFLPQQSVIYPDMTVAENLALASRLRGIAPADREAAIAAQYEQLELGPFRHRLGQDLSAGMARRTALGMALIHDPELLLLDEPTAGLDAAQAERLRQLLRRLAPGRAIVISSHLAADIEQTCGRALQLSDGLTVAEETIRRDRVLALVEFGNPPADTSLLAIEGVLKVSPVSDPQATGQRLLDLDGRSERAWPEILGGRDWQLRRFEPRRSRLSGARPRNCDGATR